MQPTAFFVLPNVGKDDFRWISVFTMLGKAIFVDFLFSQCWESWFSLISCFPNVGKADFRWFLVFLRGGKLIFAEFWVSPVRESRFSLILEFPPWRKGDFCWILSFPRSGKAIFAEFWVSPVAERRFSLIFTRRTSIKASFSYFSPVVPLRKPVFSVFRSSYPVSEWFFRENRWFNPICKLPPHLSCHQLTISHYSQQKTFFLFAFQIEFYNFAITK